MSFRVVLIHGFNKSYRDMRPLQENLELLGYKVENLNFPLTFPDIKYSVSMLKDFLLDLKYGGLNEKEEIILIGYGLGGKLIERTLRDEEVKGVVDKVILISAPLRDSVIHRRLKRVFPILDNIFKPLHVLNKKSTFKLDDSIEVGIIIGTEPHGIFSRWLGEYSDGIVNYKECLYDGAKATLKLPLIHDEIHKKMGTAKYINNFISKGVFRA
ncbi:esterase/lipase family protein [uncultured Fusobacterium sp.]|jgi:pimeloyl-ACP methyl ester carboxylesterase|uniref:Alpha/beta hydrolase n=1 Tax=Candidatus Fusobacterium pullicola TaxID=2838601 RepID=A0A9E2KX31_9FUSO|nr:alpha/beta hydrolase [uncultured Fusobacterium sp.]MBM6822391.1 alpha/beta hydrolase [Fusobacterium mortiferum]MBU3842073.1 alpha/beta hydrolase [Candidatus Fusobacterium pullicola]